MSKQAISVTLEADNITWLRGRVGATGVRSLSELLDRLVTAARQRGDAGPGRSVIGTIDIAASDAGLEEADAAVRAVFDRSLSRPLVVRDRGQRYHTARRTKKGARG
jgi:hypothetical protein